MILLFARIALSLHRNNIINFYEIKTSASNLSINDFHYGQCPVVDCR